MPATDYFGASVVWLAAGLPALFETGDFFRIT
jgi:hypothetical protein